MMVILVLVCGIMGFGSAVASLVFFEASLLQALGLCTATGLSGALLAISVALMPRRLEQATCRTEPGDLQNS